MKLTKYKIWDIVPEMHEWFLNHFPEGASHKKVIALLMGQKDTEGWIELILERFSLSGEFKEWHKNGQLKRIGVYLNGNCSGIVNEFFENGKISDAYEFGDDGLRRGKSQGFHPNGKVKYFYNHSSGVLHGEYKTFNESGAIITDGCFKNGDRDGIWKIARKGFVETVRYIFGEKHGPCVEAQDRLGTIMAYGEYVHGKRTGKWEIIYPDIPHIELNCFECIKSKAENGEALNVNQ